MSTFDKTWVNAATGKIMVPGRMVWPTLFEPRGIKNKPDSKPKFSVTLLISKTVDLSALEQSIDEAGRRMFGVKWKENKKLLRCLLETVDDSNLAEYAEDFPKFLRTGATSENPPYLVGPDTKKYDEMVHGAVYSGRWALLEGSAYPYDNVSKGVGFGVERIQFREEAEPIAGGRVRTSVGFEPMSFAPGASADAVWDPAA
jgi:hypothetical protein